MTSSEHLVSVVLPCFNERDSIVALIEAIHKELNFISHEIIVVDDNSPDGTFQTVIEKKYSFVRAFKRPSNPSLGKSIEKGIIEAKGDRIVLMDSDFNHQPHYLPFMIQNLDYYDCVSASRFVYGGRMDSRFRHVCSWVFNIWVRILTKKYITDSLYGFLAIRKDVLVQLDFSKIFWGYGDYCIRLMFYLQELPASVLQFPAINGERFAGTQNNRFFKVLLQYVWSTIQLVLSRMKRRSS